MYKYIYILPKALRVLLGHLSINSQSSSHTCNQDLVYKCRQSVGRWSGRGTRIGRLRKFGRTAIPRERRRSLWRSGRRWWSPGRRGSGHWGRSCSANSGPSSLTWLATLFWSPWSRPNGCRRRLLRWWWGPSWSKSGHWWWTLFHPSSHRVPCKNFKSKKFNHIYGFYSLALCFSHFISWAGPLAQLAQPDR